MELFLVCCAWIILLTLAVVILWTKLEILSNRVNSHREYQEVINNLNARSYEVLELLINQIKEQYREHEDRLNSIPKAYVIHKEPLNSEEALHNAIYMQMGVDEISEDNHYEEIEENSEEEL